MSGDSPNAFTNENVFDFKEGRSSPTPTTSKENNPGVVTASVLVEPPKEKSKDKEDDDHPDFPSPTLNPGADKESKRPDGYKGLELSEPKYDDSRKDDKKEDQNLLNGLDRLPNPYGRPKEDCNSEDDAEEDTCLVNCIYYTMECCKCSIV